MNKPIRALLLSAGYGTRLRPLTNSKPKCLLEIGGKVILESWFNKLELVSCVESLVNTHHLSNLVDEFILSYKSNVMNISNVYEKELLGTAGTLIFNKSFFRESTGLLIHTDNVTDMYLDELLHAHSTRPSCCLITMLTFDCLDPSGCGIVEIDDNSVVTGFYEKVNSPPSNRANAAVYVFDEDFFTFLDELGPGISDMSTQVLPALLGRIYTFHTSEPYLDIGTPDNLQRAHEIWPAPSIYKS